MEFITTGEKVKKIRKYLKITQEELQDESISRGLISMIEIGKRILTKDVAIKLVDKFKQKARKLNINLEIDEGYLLRSPDEDAELYCEKLLKDSNSYDDIDEVFKIACEFNLFKIKAGYYSKKADLHMNTKDYANAFINYNEALTIYRDINQYEIFPYLYWKIGLCEASLCKYKDALVYFNISERYSIMYGDNNVKQKVMYNKALCYKKVNKLDLALDCIDKYLLLLDEKDDTYFYANILKSNCYETMGRYDEAIELYNYLCIKLLESDNFLLGYIYNNLGLAYLHKYDFKNSLKYFDMSENIRSLMDKQNLSHTIIEKSEVFIKNNFYNDAIKTIELGLKYASLYKDYEYMLKGNYKLVDIYERLKDTENLKEIYLVIADILKESNNINELVSIYIKLSLIYLDESDINKARDCLIMSQNLNA